MGKMAYYPAYARGAVLLCLDCAGDDVRSGKRPPFDEDEEQDPTFHRMAFFALEGKRCSRCHKLLAPAKGGQVR